ncbi:MAG: polyprenyl synthetase family protein [Acidimicrobiales bacterium]
MSTITATPPASRREVEQRLRLYRSYTWDVMRHYLLVKEPKRYLWDIVRDYPVRGGKGLRPGLCIATCRAFGGSIEDALHASASIELLHSAILVHDDIADGSTRRRGRPTLSEKHGIPLALNAGDALAFLSVEALYPTLALLRLRAAPLMAMFQETVRCALEGQAVELGWIRENVCDLTESDYLRMTLLKTCWYSVIQPCRAGAHIGTRGRADPSDFLRFGFFLGAAFQIRDDLKNLEQEDGPNEIRADDLIEGKRTLTLINLLQVLAPDERQELVAFLALPRERKDPNVARHFAALMKRRGCIDHARGWMHALANRAIEEFEQAYGDVRDSDDKRFLRGLVPYLLV